MDLNLFSTFVRVVDQGSFTKAARLLKQPKSRVSRHIATLESKLGRPLLYRSTRQLSLTETGRGLYESIKSHIYSLEGSTENLSAGSHEVSGVLKLTVAEDLGSMLLGPFLAELTRRYPKLAIDLHLSNQIVDLVRDGLDVAIRIGDLEDTSLKARLIGSVTSKLFASPKYLKSAPEIKRLSDLADHATLHFEPEGQDNTWTLLRGGREQSIQIHPFCKANHPKILLDLAVAGRGVALIPEFLVVDELKRGTLVQVLPELTGERTPVHFVWPAQKGENPKLRACVDVGVEILANYFRQ